MGVVRYVPAAEFPSGTPRAVSAGGQPAGFVEPDKHARGRRWPREVDHRHAGRRDRRPGAREEADEAPKRRLMPDEQEVRGGRLLGDDGEGLLDRCPRREAGFRVDRHRDVHRNGHRRLGRPNERAMHDAGHGARPPTHKAAYCIGLAEASRREGTLRITLGVMMLSLTVADDEETHDRCTAFSSRGETKRSAAGSGRRRVALTTVRQVARELE